MTTSSADPTQPASSPADGGRSDWPARTEGALLDEADRADLLARLAMTPMERLLELEQVVHELSLIRRADVSSR